MLITPLSAIWLITLGLCGLFVSLFNLDWHRHAGVQANGLLINALMAAAVCAVVADNFGVLVVMAEIMALCAVFLTGCGQSAKLWFVLGRIWPAGGDYSAARLGAAGPCECQRARGGAVLYRGDENRPVRHPDIIARGR
ncbi:MAG: formate hydrogenlyase subunit 3 [Enterobacter kobei]|nr:formate hydrogenlyase subunit 3 [Enterobacter kobei]